jgi:hypothetical protein
MEIIIEGVINWERLILRKNFGCNTITGIQIGKFIIPSKSKNVIWISEDKSEKQNDNTNWKRE